MYYQLLNIFKTFASYDMVGMLVVMVCSQGKLRLVHDPSMMVELHNLANILECYDRNYLITSYGKFFVVFKRFLSLCRKFEI